MFDFIINNVGSILGSVGAIHSAALIIVNATPTPKDNVILERVYTIVEWCAGIFTSIAKK